MALALVTSACTGRSTSTADYRLKVANAAQAMHSSLSAAALQVRIVRDDKAIPTTLEDSLAQAYSDASNVEPGLNAVQPPTATAVKLQERVDSVLSDATSLLLSLRVVAGRGDDGQLPAMLPKLRAMIARVEKFEKA